MAVASTHVVWRIYSSNNMAYYCSLQTLSSDTVVSASWFASCQSFPPCQKLLTRSFVQNTTYDATNVDSATCTLSGIQRTGPPTAKWWGWGMEHTSAHGTVLQTHSTNNRTMKTARETRCNNKYPNDAAAAVLVSSEAPLVHVAHHNDHVHSTARQMPAGSLAIACSPILTMHFPRPEADGRITKSWVLLSSRLSWKSPHLLFKVALPEHSLDLDSSKFPSESESRQFRKLTQSPKLRCLNILPKKTQFSTCCKLCTKRPHYQT